MPSREFLLTCFTYPCVRGGGGARVLLKVRVENLVVKAIPEFRTYDLISVFSLNEVNKAAFEGRLNMQLSKLRDKTINKYRCFSLRIVTNPK